MDFKTRLIHYYEVCCPKKLGDVDKLVVKYASQEKELFRKLTMKYGPERLSPVEKTAVRLRTIKTQVSIPKKTKIDAIEWMDSLLTDNDRNLLEELDNYSGNNIPESILDRI